jgi:hypothetical protein
MDFSADDVVKDCVVDEVLDQLADQSGIAQSPAATDSIRYR